MNETDRLYDVEIRRLLLSLDKAQILQVAYDHGAPFFRDSTPAWSTRGRLRNEVLPSKRCVRCWLSGSRSRSWRDDQLRALCDRRVFHEAHSSISRGRLGVRIALLRFKDESPFFWRTFLAMLRTRSEEVACRGRPSTLLVQRLKGARARRLHTGRRRVARRAGSSSRRAGGRTLMRRAPCTSSTTRCLEVRCLMVPPCRWMRRRDSGADRGHDARRSIHKTNRATSRPSSRRVDLSYHVQCSTLTLAPRRPPQVPAASASTVSRSRRGLEM